MMASMRAMSINRLHAIPFSDTIATHIIATHIATITRCILVGVGDILDQNGGTSGCEGLLRLKVVVLTLAKHGSERLYQLRRNLSKLIHLQLQTNKLISLRQMFQRTMTLDLRIQGVINGRNYLNC